MMTYSKKRIEALQERLEQEGLDGLLLATGASFAYLLDMASLPFQRTSETKNQRGAPSIEADRLRSLAGARPAMRPCPSGGHLSGRFL